MGMAVAARDGSTAGRAGVCPEFFNGFYVTSDRSSPYGLRDKAMNRAGEGRGRGRRIGPSCSIAECPLSPASKL